MTGWRDKVAGPGNSRSQGALGLQMGLQVQPAGRVGRVNAGVRGEARAASRAWPGRTGCPSLRWGGGCRGKIQQFCKGRGPLQVTVDISENWLLKGIIMMANDISS